MVSRRTESRPASERISKEPQFTASPNQPVKLSGGWTVFVSSGVGGPASLPWSYGRLGFRMAIQRDAQGAILNADELDVDDVANDRVLCPACADHVFEHWPFGWDAHSAHRNPLELFQPRRQDDA